MVVQTTMDLLQWTGIGTLAAGQWEEIQATSPEVQTGGTRGIFAGGFNGSNPLSDVIDYINVSTTGNAITFDTLTSAAQMIGGGCGSRTRGLFGGQTQPAVANTVDGVEISSTGSQFDYGDLSVARIFAAQLSNQTRGITLEDKLHPQIVPLIILQLQHQGRQQKILVI